MIFEGKMGIKTDVSRKKICIPASLYIIILLSLLYAMSEEFFNLEVLVPCYSHVNIHTYIWLTLSNTPFRVVV